jgi:outer membrane lipoprotein SlyB
MTKFFTILALVGFLGACSTTSPDVIARSDAGRLSSVQTGTVEAVRAVTVEGSQSGVGATAGEQVAVGTLAAVLGGLVGNAIERQSNREEALEIVVRLPDGERRAVVQAKGAEQFRPGDAVSIVSTAGRARVTQLQRVPVEGS